MEPNPSMRRATQNGSDEARRSSYMPRRVTAYTDPEYPEPPSTHPDTGQPALGLGLSQAQSSSVDPNDPDPSIDLKRPRACEPCRQLKVRCDPDPNHPEGSCKRCAKARRTCTVTAPTRKRQRKTDSRVTELERKIDALTATLAASHSPESLFSASPPGQQRETQQVSRRWLGGESAVPGKKRQHSGELKGPTNELLASQYSRSESASAEQGHRSSSRQWRTSQGGEAARPKIDENEVDMIDLGLVELGTANAAFDHYVKQMAPEMPMVVFPPGTTMDDVRRSKPALFLVILAVAIGPFDPDLQIQLFSEVYRMIANRVVIKGEKSLELVQTVLLACIWYLPPDNLDHLKFYSIIHLAVIMAMDLGLNRRTSSNKKAFNLIRDLMGPKAPASSFDPEGPEARRTWVGCYFMAVQASAALRRFNLVQWQPYMNECLEILEKHPDALPSDRTLVWWAKLGFIMEESGMQPSADEPESIDSFPDSKVRHEMQKLASRLLQWRTDIPKEFYTDFLAQTELLVNLYLHEGAMNVDCSNSSLSSTTTFRDPHPATTTLIDALSTCIRSIHSSLDVITSINIDRFICLPTVALARTAYSVVSLIKMYSLLTSPDSRLGQLIDVQSLKVEFYLDKVTGHYRTAAAQDGARAAAKFGNILGMLRNWFLKKKDQALALKDALSSDRRVVTPFEKHRTKSETTPLHLLSEVAMGDPANRVSSSGTSASYAKRIVSGLNYAASTSTATGAGPDFGVSSTPTPGTSGGGASNTEPDILSRGSSSKEGNWSSASFAFSGSLAGPTDAGIGNGAFYSPLPSTTDTSNTYPGMNTSTQTQTQGYADISSLGASRMQHPGQGGMGMFPELGMDAGFDPNNLFALGGMMDEAFFDFPFSFDPNMEFY